MAVKLNEKQQKQPILHSIYALIKPPMEIFTDVFSHYSHKLYLTLLANRNDAQYYRFLIGKATSYEQWAAAGYMLDRIEGNDKWKTDEKSKFYDHKLIRERLNILRTIRKNGDIPAMIFNLRTSLSRSLGDMGNPMLYEYTHVGTKELIEDYIDEVTKQLNFICDVEIPEFNVEDKLQFLQDTQKAFGRTALLLSGGGTFGLAHAGVVKVLVEQDMLPRIITGSSAGSIVAALICSRNDKELHFLMDSSMIDLNFFERENEQGNPFIRLSRFMKHGVVFDVQVFNECMYANLGDITFLEAYNRTRRVLNITVSSSTNFEMPRLLNYLTAPNVIIRSAVAASCALPYVYKAAPLLAKDAHKNIVPWNTSGHRWIDGSVEGDLPMQRIGELFGVNHYCVAQANPYIIPFLPAIGAKSSALGRGIRLLGDIVSEELAHRLAQLIDLGIHNFPLFKGHSILTQKYVGDVTMVPQFKLTEYFSIMSTPTTEMFKCYSKKGEQATWPKIAILRNHLNIEQCINRNLMNLRGKLISEITMQRTIPYSFRKADNLQIKHGMRSVDPQERSSTTHALPLYISQGGKSIENLKARFAPTVTADSNELEPKLELSPLERISATERLKLLKSHRSAGDFRNSLGQPNVETGTNNVPTKGKTTDPLFYMDLTFEDSDSDLDL